MIIPLTPCYMENGGPGQFATAVGIPYLFGYKTGFSSL